MEKSLNLPHFFILSPLCFIKLFIMHFYFNYLIKWHKSLFRVFIYIFGIIQQRIYNSKCLPLRLSVCIIIFRKVNTRYSIYIFPCKGNLLLNYTKFNLEQVLDVCRLNFLNCNIPPIVIWPLTPPLPHSLDFCICLFNTPMVISNPVGFFLS